MINDPAVKEYLGRCRLPMGVDEIRLAKDTLHVVSDQAHEITHVIAIDGGTTEVPVKKGFPSSTVTFFQFGVNMFSVADLDEIGEQAFIAPEAMARLKEIERFKLVLPTRNVSLTGNTTIAESIRRTLHEFFLVPRDEKGTRFAQSLKWFLFEEYRATPIESIVLASCPTCGAPGVPITRSLLRADYAASCKECQRPVYLVDAFRLHEAVDNELGAGGIVGYVTVLIEQLILVHYIRYILLLQPEKLSHILFLKDGPLAFFGQTANMHVPMRRLCSYLEQRHNLFLAGLTKSGAFVEHVKELTTDPTKFPRNHYFIPDNKYIYSHIQPGDPENAPPFGSSSYYGCNVIFRAPDGGMHIVTLPASRADVVKAPAPSAFRNIDTVLQCVGRLKCDMYDSALLPIALVNKLVSLSNHPSAVLLQKFAKGTIA